MPDQFGTATAAVLEQCIDDIDDFVSTLERFPASVIALALRIHLGALLRSMLDEQLCSLEEVRQFVLALEQESVGGSGV
jgi:hypothetical protein